MRLTTIVLTAALVCVGAECAAGQDRCANDEAFVQGLLEIERSTGFDLVTGSWRCSSGTIRVQVTNGWFSYQCHERRQLLTSLNTSWQADGGVRLILIDVTEADVASVGVFGGIDIEGCNDHRTEA